MKRPEARLKASLAQHARYGTDRATRRSPRGAREMGRWAHDVITRDGATCVYCGHKKRADRDIHAHHILSKAKHPAMALLVSNGITLCKPCHRQEHRINGII